MTNLERLTIKAITEWCKKNDMHPTQRLRHIHPRAYVLGKAASQCLLIATPLIDAEQQVKKSREIMGADGSTTVHTFDKNLRVGDWCSVAYVCINGRQEQVAIPAVSA